MKLRRFNSELYIAYTHSGDKELFELYKQIKEILNKQPSVVFPSSV
jgi:hypothetical protein